MKLLDVLVLPIPHVTSYRATVAKVEDGIRRETCAQVLDVREPLPVEAVGQVAVAVVVDLIAEEDDLLVVTEHPRAVVRRLARPEIDDCEGDVVERDTLAVSDRCVREDAVGRPVVAEHRPDDLVLERVVATDRVDHALRCKDRNVIVGDDLPQPGVVVGMRLRDQHSAQRLADAFEAGAHLPGRRDLEQPVDGDHAGLCLDEVRVDEGSLGLGRKAMDRRFTHRTDRRSAARPNANDSRRDERSTRLADRGMTRAPRTLLHVRVVTQEE